MKPHLVLALLPLAATASLASADVVAPGFTSTQSPYPTGAAIRTLADGSLITCDGAMIQRWTPGGALVSTLGQFSASGEVGLMVVDPTETFVLVGNATTGEILRVNLGGSGQAFVADLPGNHHAAFESDVSAIVSVESCGTSCGTALVRLNVMNGNQVHLAAAAGAAGPVGLDADDNLFYGSPMSGELMRFGAGAIASPPPPAFQANNGLVVIEVESAPPAGDWEEQTQFPGFTGDSYYRWTGPDLFSSPGQGVLSYDFEITEPGNYIFHYHNRHENPASDQANDAWVRVNDDQWIKVFSNNGPSSVGVWNWFSVAEVGSSQFELVYDLPAGRHTLQISGRSKGFAIDRMVLYRPSVSQPMSLGHPEAVKAAFNETDAVVVADDLIGATEMVHDAEQDVFLIAENGSAGKNRIRRITPSGEASVLLEGDLSQKLRNLDFTPQHGLGVFTAFQPPSNGELAYTRTVPGALNEHRVLAPRRPSVTFSGPGATTGIGPVTVSLKGGFPNGVAIFALAPAGAVVPVEGVVDLPSSPPLFIGLLPTETTLFPLVLPCNPSGAATLTFPSPFGAPDLLGVQAIAFDPNGKLAGSSAPAVL